MQTASHVRSPMLRQTASVAILALIVASCGTAATPEESAVQPSQTGSSAVASPATSVAPQPVTSVAPQPVTSVAPQPVASAAPQPIASTSPSPAQTPGLGSVVTSFKLVSPGTGWVETVNALLVTRDDGSSWVNATPNGDLGTIGLDAIDGQVAFVATDE